LGEFAIQTLRGTVVGLGLGLLMGGLLMGVGLISLPLPAMLIASASLGLLLGREWDRGRGLRKEARHDALESGSPDDLAQLKDQFFSTMTHELRTPLTSIRSFAEILQSTPPDEEEVRQEFLEIIHDEAERMSRLVNELLDISKIESGCMAYDFTAVDLAEQGRLVTRLFRPPLQEKRISLELDFPEGLSPVHADRDRVHQILTNLVGNATRYSPEGGRIRLSARSRGEEMEFQVEDQGRGVPKDDRETIFDPYKQVEVQGGAREGTGLGLPISRLLVENMGGSIHCAQSSDLGGACFVFRLPMIRSPQVSSDQEPIIALPLLEGLADPSGS
jgi:phosphoserine phosphatase RsbU/P